MGSHAATQVPTTASSGPATNVQVLECAAQVTLHAVTCLPASPKSGASADVILGGQGQFVQLTSTNIAYAGGVFSFDATVRNLIPQPLATTNGTTGDANGVRVFFNTGPTVTAGTGNASIQNNDGVGMFITSNQPYFQYSGGLLGADGILSQNETSGSKNWKLNVDPTVTTFTFQVFVSTTVQHPMGFVQMSKDSNFVNVGGSDALTASVRSFAGSAVSGAAPIAWASTNTSVATVDASGNISAVAPGVAMITATSDTLVGHTSIQVCPVFGSVGTSVVISGANASSVCMAGGSSATAEYVAVPFNGTTSGSAAMSFLGTGIAAVTGPPNPNLIPTGSGLALASRSAAMSNGELAGHLALMNRIRASLPSHGSLAGAHFASRINRSTSTTTFKPSTSVAAKSLLVSPRGPSRYIVQNEDYEPGDPILLDVNNICLGTQDERTATVIARSAHAIIAEENSVPANGFTLADYQAIAAEFDTTAYAIASTNFNAPLDREGAGAVVIFFTKAVNELNTNGTSTPVYGYFSAKDFHPRDTSPVGCFTSNQGDILYSAVPDPTGTINGNTLDVATLRPKVMPLLTHNIVHMVHEWYRGWVSAPSLSFIPESPWLEEAMANAANELAFFKGAGLSTRSNVQASSLTGSALAQDAFNSQQAANFARLGQWLARPDSTGVYLGNPGEQDFAPTANVASAGASWAFLRYAADRVGGSEASFWHALTISADTGMTNLGAAIGGASPETWARDFATSMYADDAVSGVAPEYLDATWNYRSVFGTVGGFNLHTTPLTTSVASPITLNVGATSYLRFGVASNAFGRLNTMQGGGAPASTTSLTIIRTK